MKVFSKTSSTKFNQCDGALSRKNVQPSCLTSFWIVGNNCFLMFAIILFIYLNAIFIHKNSFMVPYQEIAAETMTFLDILFVEHQFFSFSIYPVILQVNRNVNSKFFFIMPYCFFNHADIAFKFSANASLSSIATSIIYFGSFYPFELMKDSSFSHSYNRWTTDSSLFGNYTKC